MDKIRFVVCIQIVLQSCNTENCCTTLHFKIPIISPKSFLIPEGNLFNFCGCTGASQVTVVHLQNNATPNYILSLCSLKTGHRNVYCGQTNQCSRSVFENFETTTTLYRCTPCTNNTCNSLSLGILNVSTSFKCWEEEWKHYKVGKDLLSQLFQI